MFLMKNERGNQPPAVRKSGLGLNIYRYNIGAGWDENNCRVTNPWRRCESFYVLKDNENEEDFDGEYDFGKDKNAYEFLKQSLKENTVDTVILLPIPLITLLLQAVRRAEALCTTPAICRTLIMRNLQIIFLT